MTIKWSSLGGTGHDLCYLRKDILDGFLKRKRLEFMWAFWGAREIRFAAEKYRNHDKQFKHLRKEYQRIYRYKESLVTYSKASEYYD